MFPSQFLPLSGLSVLVGQATSTDPPVKQLHDDESFELMVDKGVAVIQAPTMYAGGCPAGA